MYENPDETSSSICPYCDIIEIRIEINAGLTFSSDLGAWNYKSELVSDLRNELWAGDCFNSGVQR